MKSYLELAPKYLSAHRRKTRLAIVSIVISVALITGTSSMMDVLLRFEKQQVIHDYGNYHLAVKDVSDREIPFITSRIDVQNSGRWKDLGDGAANGIPCRLGSIDEAFTENMNIKLKQGKYPTEKNEIMLEQWATESLYLNVHIGDKVQISFANNIEGEFIVSGICNDLGNMKAAGVVMIYNTFNISVMERVRQFGLLRCVGASQSQIKKLIRREGFTITLRAIPFGVLAGMLVTFACSVVLKFFNGTIFGEIPLFSISITCIGAGIIVGFLTVFIASFLPAKKAARVSPINAVTGSNDIKISKIRKRGYLTKILHAEIAMGINNATMRKKTLFLMSCSIAISIIMFLGFNVLINFMHASLKTTKPYTPDISLSSEQGISDELYDKLSGLDGVKKAYGRMYGYIDATFDALRLANTYKERMGITIKDNGLFVPPEKSWLISYDKNQLNWSKADLIVGEISEDKMNENNGVIAVASHLRENITTVTANLQLGDKVYINTPAGTKELTVMGILRSVPFNSTELTLTTFITTEALFTDVFGESAFKAVNIQLKRVNDEHTVDTIKGMVDGTVSFHDMRQKNVEINQMYFTMAVFVYGFVAVIALISILNIINTMNTSVASKTRYLGVVRAVGMSCAQLNKMILTEAATYTLTGCLSGCILGVMLQKALIDNFLSSLNVIWKFPLIQIVLILIIAIFVTIISVIGPLKRIRSKGISEVVNSL
jgi:putative ABC transport system permease protein